MDKREFLEELVERKRRAIPRMVRQLERAERLFHGQVPRTIQDKIIDSNGFFDVVLECGDGSMNGPLPMEVVFRNYGTFLYFSRGILDTELNGRDNTQGWVRIVALSSDFITIEEIQQLRNLIAEGFSFVYRIPVFHLYATKGFELYRRCDDIISYDSCPKDLMMEESVNALSKFLDGGSSFCGLEAKYDTDGSLRILSDNGGEVFAKSYREPFDDIRKTPKEIEHPSILAVEDTVPITDTDELALRIMRRSCSAPRSPLADHIKYRSMTENRYSISEGCKKQYFIKDDKSECVKRPMYVDPYCGDFEAFTLSES